MSTCCGMLWRTSTNFGPKAARSWKDHQIHAILAYQYPPAHCASRTAAIGRSYGRADGPGRRKGSRGVRVKLHCCRLLP
eukprot:4205596-Alexandrium_andersonii.AAC.1